jgi:hypothetical protein
MFEFRRVAPPMFRAPNQTTRKKRSATSSPQDTTTDGVNLNKPEVVVDVDSIHSPIIKPISRTIVEEQQVLEIEEIDVDT